jgi:hypothetical protein
MIRRWLSLSAMFIFLTGFSCADTDKNPNFEFSGVHEFWKIMDVLIQDKEPTDEQWDALFNTPGYAELLRREFKAETFKQYYRAAYRPSKRVDIEKMKNAAEDGGNKFRIWFTNAMFESLDYSLKNKEKIVVKVKSFDTFPYTENAIEELLIYLPEEMVGAPPDVSFIIFNDSRGYTPVIMSINELTREEELLSPERLAVLKKQGYTKQRPHVLYFAHEYFHYYRDQNLEFKFPDQESDDYSLIWRLDQIENEGIADLINVSQLYLNGCCFANTAWAEQIREEQAQQPDVIRAFDKILSAIHDNPSKQKELNAEITRLITRAGHPAGFYMANIISEQFGRQALVDVVRNPFKFFYKYNNAAKKDGTVPVFSKKSIQLITELEGKYSLSP